MNNENLMLGDDNLFLVVPYADREDTYRLIFACRGCAVFQVDVDGSDTGHLYAAAMESATGHFAVCPQLQLITELNQWWHAVSVQSADEGQWIGDHLERLRPYADWHVVEGTTNPPRLIGACQFCNWQADAPLAAKYAALACLYALNDHRRDCPPLDTLAALGG